MDSWLQRLFEKKAKTDGKVSNQEIQELHRRLDAIAVKKHGWDGEWGWTEYELKEEMSNLEGWLNDIAKRKKVKPKKARRRRSPERRVKRNNNQQVLRRFL